MVKMKTKDLTFVSLLLTVGIVLKGLTDSLMRTALFFLMWDPLTIINVCIFLKYKDKKYLFAIMVVETVLAATIFTTTDVFFFRPIDILMTYFICTIIKKERVKLKYFLSTFCTLFLNIFGFLGLLLLNPEMLNVDIPELDRLFVVMEQMDVWGKLFGVGIFIIVVIVWLCLPSLINMFLGKKVTETIDKIAK